MFLFSLPRFLLILVLFNSCFNTESSRIEFALGTVCSITLYEHGRDDVYDKVFARIKEIENLMSVHVPSSDVSRVNAAAGAEPVVVDKETFFVIERALFFAEKSGGAFDPTVGPLVSLWGFGGNERVPSREEIDEALQYVGWRNVVLDAEKNSVFLTRQGMALDLGAIAKGYAGDEAARIIQDAGVKRAMIDLGGNIVVLGSKKDNKPWRVGVQNPAGDRGDIIGVLQITEGTVVTSGVYERYFEEGGKRYHHIFSPFSGYPAESGLLSVTVVSHNSLEADALSTALFVLGYEEGIALLKSFPGTDAVFVFEDFGVKFEKFSHEGHGETPYFRRLEFTERRENF